MKLYPGYWLDRLTSARECPETVAREYVCSLAGHRHNGYQFSVYPLNCRPKNQPVSFELLKPDTFTSDLELLSRISWYICFN